MEGKESTGKIACIQGLLCFAVTISRPRYRVASENFKEVFPTLAIWTMQIVASSVCLKLPTVRICYIQPNLLHTQTAALKDYLLQGKAYNTAQEKEQNTQVCVDWPFVLLRSTLWGNPSSNSLSVSIVTRNKRRAILFRDEFPMTSFYKAINYRNLIQVPVTTLTSCFLCA